MKFKGAQILIKSLIDNGVDTIFGYPGGSVLNIYDALYEYSDKITHIITSHEQGASHSADGYARATGKVGVCLATSGPGATNLVTGIATAYMDSIPMVAITGNVDKTLLGRDSFQEVDITGVTMPITKHNYIVDDIKDLQAIVNEAFLLANSGRKGPVLIDIPKNVTIETYEYIENFEKPTYHLREDLSKLDEAVKLINASKKPIIYAGGGIISSNASEELIKFAEKANIPVALSLMGLGGFPSSHPLFLGMIGMHGKIASDVAVYSSDLVIAIGSRFSDRVATDRNKFANNANIIHIDIDNAEIDKNVSSNIQLVMDAKKALTELTNKIKENDHTKWLSYIHKRASEIKLGEFKSSPNPKEIISLINELTDSDQIIATDVGQHQMWTAMFYPFEKQRTLITSGGLGTMGFGLGASIGACIGSKKMTILVTGDGSFHMNMNEVATAVKYNLPIKIVILNNKVLGMVRQWQSLFYNKHYSQTSIEKKTDYIKLAEAFGAKGYKIDKMEGARDILSTAFNEDGVSIIDITIDKDEMVLPMIPTGKSLDDVITGNK